MSHAAARKTNDLLSFVTTAAFIGGGYWLWKASRKHDVLAVDVNEARPTRHMVDLHKRIDKDALAKWLEEAEREDTKPKGEK